MILSIQLLKILKNKNLLQTTMNMYKTDHNMLAIMMHEQLASYMIV